MGEYRCPYCSTSSETWPSARSHVTACPTYKSRLAALGFDLEVAVTNGKMSLEDAEKKQAERPRLVL